MQINIRIMFKIAIVGPQEDKWTEEQKRKAKDKIYDLIKHANMPNWGGDSWFHFRAEQGIEFLENTTLVSGHCPKGGIDIFAEEIADELGVKKEIFEPEVEQWEDLIVTEGKNLIGYKTRNILIAEDCDIIYCIVPYNPIKTCYHHKGTEEPTRHPHNGGCWTMNYCRKNFPNKHTELIIIE
jgi:hypothetical protein